MTVVQELFAELKLQLDENSFKDGDKALATVSDAAIGMAKKVAGAFAAAFAVDAIVDFVHGSIQAIPAIGDIADQAGITAESLQRLRFAFSQSGADAEDFDKGIKRLSRNIGDAATGNEAVQKSFADIGVKIKDASGKIKSADAVFLEIADKIAGIEDKSKQAAFATSLLGNEGGLKLLAGMRQGAQGLNELGDEAEKLNLIMGRDTIDKFGEVDDKINAVTAQFKGLAYSAIVPFLDVLKETFNYIQKTVIPALSRIPKIIKENIRILKSLATVIGVVLVYAFVKYIASLVAAFWAQAALAAEAGFLAGSFGTLVAAIDMIIFSMTTMISTFVSVVAPILGVIAALAFLFLVVEDLWTSFEGGDGLLMKLAGHWGEFADAMWNDFMEADGFIESLLLGIGVMVANVGRGIEFVINDLILKPIEKAMELIDDIMRFFDADSTGKQIMIRDAAKSAFGGAVDNYSGVANFAGATSVASGLQTFKETGSRLIDKGLTPSKSVNLNAGGTTINVEIAGSSSIDGQSIARDIAGFANDGQSRIINQAAQDIIAAP